MTEEIKKKEEIIPRDIQRTIIVGVIEGLKKELFSSRLTERYFQRRVIVQSSYQMQLGKVQQEIKDNEAYLEFLEEILKDEY